MNEAQEILFATIKNICNRAGKMTSRQMMDGLHPMGRIGTPDEVAGLIVWLCSAEAGFMTGAVVPVDGGYVAQ